MPEAVAATIGKRNGAYFISIHEPTSSMGYSTPEELYDCASSLVVAKRVAVALAKKQGWSGPWKWDDSDELFTLVLYGVEPDEDNEDDD